MKKSGNTPCGIAIPQDLIFKSGGMAPIRRFVQRADVLNYDSLWVMEGIVSRAPNLEPVSILSYAAALTQKVRLGVAVIVLTQRNPVQLAKALTSLDRVSDGRLDVGIGIGRQGAEEAFGYSSERRVTRFEEALQVMKVLWTEQPASHSGVFWNFESVSMKPRPVQRPHPPIWFGGRVPAALKRAARLGDGFIGAGSSSFEAFKTQYGLLQQFLEEQGRDPERFGISKRVYVAIDDDRGRAEARLKEWFGYYYGNAEMAPRVAAWGSRDECLDRLGEYVQAGAKHLLLNPVLDEMEHLEILAEEIVPYL
jgi:probable F420-dependent oxidoreductase